jgi:hypothetical protein
LSEPGFIGIMGIKKVILDDLTHIAVTLKKNQDNAGFEFF